MTGSKGKRPVRQEPPAPKPTKPSPAPSTPAPPSARHRDSGKAPKTPPPGLDDTRHAAAQRRANQAAVLRDGVFPVLMGTALGLDKCFEAGAYKTYLTDVMRDLGDPTDPVERMLVEQLCLVHFRVGQLHGAAGQATGLEAMKLLNTVTARMLGEMRRTALSLKAYRSSAVPAKSEKARVKLFKAAQ